MSRRRDNRSIALAVLLLLATGRGAGTSVAAQGWDTRIAFMQDVMYAAFPALAAGQGTVVIKIGTSIGSRWDRPADIYIDVYPASMKTPPKDPDRGYLRADFHYQGETFDMATFFGDVVNQRRLDEFDRLQSSGHVSTREQLEETLTRLGAKFGPDKRAAFIAQLDLARFEKVLGRIRDRKIDFVSGLHSDATFNSRPRWAVRLRTGDGPKTTCFVLQFEPFEGQVQAILGTAITTRDVCGDP